MKLLSGFGRLIKSIIGWLFLIVFGGTGVYGLLDGKRDEPAVVVVCLLLAGIGVLLIVSARRDKKRAAARDEEETQYRRRQEEQARERAERERREAVPFVAVECPGCGAVARVRRGGVGRCEYCGTVLEGNLREQARSPQRPGHGTGERKSE